MLEWHLTGWQLSEWHLTGWQQPERQPLGEICMVDGIFSHSNSHAGQHVYCIHDWKIDTNNDINILLQVQNTNCRLIQLKFNFTYKKEWNYKRFIVNKSFS